MRKLNLTLLILTLSFAVLMSVPFLVPHMGWVALLGLVPLLLMDEVADAHGVKRFFWWYFLAFVLWNAATTFWVCNATVGGGIFAVVANSVQMSLIWALFRFAKKKLEGVSPYVFLAAMWIAWERMYFNVQISWPWLTLGNSLARSVRLAQWYEYTGVLGGSLWIWVSNIWLFLIARSAIDGSRFAKPLRSRLISDILCAAVILLPVALSLRIFARTQPCSDESLEVVVAQPNFDPYEKFVSMTQAQQNVILVDLLEQGLRHRDGQGGPVLLLGPETFTSDIVLGREEHSPTWERICSLIEAHPEANIIFGASTRECIGPEKGKAYTARKFRDGNWYISHNSAFITDTTRRTDVFQKSRLVIGVESMPWPRVFSWIDDKLGGVMGRCVGQDTVKTLHFRSYGPDGEIVQDIPIGCAVCYESVYGEYCTGYVKDGARALTVITNDAWWGDTPGYRQHLSYACLRAIETRRDIARCGNTGISGFINRRGEITSESRWWEREHIEGRISLYDGQTFFVRHGDITGRACTLVFFLFFLALLVRLITRK